MKCNKNMQQFPPATIRNNQLSKLTKCHTVILFQKSNPANKRLQQTKKQKQKNYKKAILSLRNSKVQH